MYLKVSLNGVHFVSASMCYSIFPQINPAWWMSSKATTVRDCLWFIPGEQCRVIHSQPDAGMCGMDGTQCVPRVFVFKHSFVTFDPHFFEIHAAVTITMNLCFTNECKQTMSSISRIHVENFSFDHDNWCFFDNDVFGTARVCLDGCEICPPPHSLSYQWCSWRQRYQYQKLRRTEILVISVTEIHLARWTCK